MRTSLVSAIYAKGIESKGLHEAKPEILNLMSTDTDRIVNSCISFHSFWSIPFQLFTTLYLLYTQLKFAFVPGVIFAIILIPINRYIAVKIGKLSSFLMTAKDKRVSLTTEAMTGAKQIKMQALEDIFIERISELRKNEILYLSKRKYLDAWCVYFWATTPVLMCLLTFGGMALFGKPLTASVVFTSVALLNLLIGPLNAFPWVLNGLMEAFVSLKRVQELINLENIDFTKYYSPLIANYTKVGNDNPVIISIRNGSFAFEKERDRSAENVNVEDVRDFKLENVNLEVRQGELVVIDGVTGSGKSALLNAILGNLKKTGGEF
jgi:ATP-binding cassette, subfamily C (CFTR/MRP), member 10